MREGKLRRAVHLVRFVGLTILLFSCEPNKPEEHEIWIDLSTPISYTSNEPGSAIKFDYYFHNATGTGRSLSLQLWQYGSFLVTLGNQYFGASAEIDGSGTFSWNGRRSAAWGETSTSNPVAPVGRTLPIAPGNYELLIVLDASGGVKKSQAYSITVESNTYDSDGDGISDAVEDQNGGVTGFSSPIVDEYGGEHYDWYVSADATRPPILSISISSPNVLYPNRGTHDYSLAKGSVSSGTLHNGLRISHGSTGYIYVSGNTPECDVPDTDNWGTVELVNLIEAVGRKWRAIDQNYPDMVVKDMSKAAGGPFTTNEYTNCLGHAQHQNGLEVDIRNVRQDRSTDPVQYTDTQNYSRARTQQLVNLFFQLGNIVLIYSADQQLTGITYDSKHTDHLHVWIQDPDGSN